MRKAVAIRNLRPGMEVIALDCDWSQTPFWRKRFIIQSADDIIRLGEYCQHVMVQYPDPEDSTAPRTPEAQAKPTREKQTEPALTDLAELLPAEGLPASDTLDTMTDTLNVNTGGETERQTETKQQAADKPMEKKPVSEKMQQLKAKVTADYAQASAEETRQELDNMFTDIRSGGVIHSSELYAAVNHLLVSSIAQPEVLAMMSHLTPKTGSLAQKSTDVCIWSLLFARQLGMNRDELIQIGLGALLHDIGMLKVPESLLKQEGVLSVGQRLLIQQHVEDGRALIGRDSSLKRIDVIVAYHHERYDGTGYPSGIRGKRIPLMARILSIVMAYEAMTRDRLYKASDNPTQALSQLYQLRNKHFDGLLVQRFISCVGVYPIGTLVQLDDLTIALVTEIHPDKRSLPTVRRILSPEQQILASEDPVDLSLNHCKSHILRTIEPAELSEEVLKGIQKLMHVSSSIVVPVDNFVV